MRKIIVLPEPYKRALSCGIDSLRNLLDRLHQYLRASEDVDTLQADALAREIHELQNKLCEITNDLELCSTEDNLRTVLLSTCSKMWEIAHDLKTEKLRGYGKTPRGLAEYLNPRVNLILKSIDRMLTIGKKGGHK